MKALAAILVEPGRPLVLDELEIPAPRPGQALVEVAWSGVCHTQLLECRGFRGHDRFLPHCLGHEGSGVVLEVGPGVTKAKAGDRVVLSWIKGSGADVAGMVYGWGDRRVNAGSITTFMRRAMISEYRLTVLREDADLRAAALVGCAVPTGLGAVLNVARPLPGQSLAVFGAGGIGLCAVAGAALAGCTPVVAVDVVASKLDLARKMGASHGIDASRGDPLEELLELVPGGVDFAVEASGRPAVMAQALRAVRDQGGAAVVIGNARFGETLAIDPRQLNMGKRLLGTWGGDNQPDRDYPRYLRLLQTKKLDLAPLLGASYRLRDIERALEDMEAGRVGRPLIDMSLE